MPCLNEAETLRVCIERAQKLLADKKINGEILISDNGSTDGSQEIVRSLKQSRPFWKNRSNEYEFA